GQILLVGLTLTWLFFAATRWHEQNPISLAATGGLTALTVLTIIYRLRARRHAVAPAIARSRAKEAQLSRPPTGRNLLGCFLLAAVAIICVSGLIAYGIYLASQGINTLWKEASQQTRTWDNIESNFSAPAADVADEKLFPKKLGEFDLVGINSLVSAP